MVTSVMDMYGYQFLVLDVDSGNALAYFDEPEPAVAYVHEIVENGHRDPDTLALVACDKSGLALDSRLGSDLLALNG